jgi:hypothetical protein
MQGHLPGLLSGCVVEAVAAEHDSRLTHGYVRADLVSDAAPELAPQRRLLGIIRNESS